MKNRIDWIDISKGILIILVVLGHSQISTLLKILINSFHMPAFFILSGITFKSSINFNKFVKKKFFSLIMPYLIFSFIMILYQLTKAFLFSGYKFDIISGLVSIVLPISGRVATSVYGLWFLPCLFLTEILAYFIFKSKEKIILCQY